MAEAVGGVVAKQVEIGIDIVSDGEMSKIGYATYIRHRLSGFETARCAVRRRRTSTTFPNTRKAGSARRDPQVPSPDLLR